MIEVAVGSATHRGHVRDVNEDSLLAAAPVFVVADGMGGHEAGDVASRIVVEELTALTGADAVEPDAVRQALEACDERVRALTGDDGVPLGAGTTVAGIVAVERDGHPFWLVVNVGDSRVYRLADGELRQVSVDHSLVQELVDDGVIDAASARTHPQRNVITRAVGGAGAFEPDYWLLPPVAGERLLICSDGLTNEVEDAVIRDVLAAEPDPAAAVDKLVAAALDAGGHDNVSVVVVDVLAVPGDVEVSTQPRGATGR
jgi:protein phosphatase